VALGKANKPKHSLSLSKFWHHEKQEDEAKADQVSVSCINILFAPFCTKVAKEYAQKMLIKLTTGVNFISILRAFFVQKSFRQLFSSYM